VNPERWRQVETLYHTALEREPGEPRIKGRCGNDGVEALIAQQKAKT
jgi:hypothetical protein